VTSKILLIENDPAFAARLSGALEASGFDVRTTGDGKAGLDLAGDLRPDAIVLCVELPKMSGYIICGKLKKDDALKGIPLVLTSSEATPETFDKHRQLKGRAEEYLLKPFEPDELVAKLGALVGLPEPALLDDDDEEGEVLSLEEDLAAEPLTVAVEDEFAALGALDLDSLPDEPPLETGSLEDDALKLLDDAFDGIAATSSWDSEAPSVSPHASGRPPPGPELPRDLPIRMRAAPRAEDRAIDLDELDARVASLPDLDGALEDTPLAALGEEAEEALDALGFDVSVHSERSAREADAQSRGEPEETDAGMPLVPERSRAPARRAAPPVPVADDRALAALREALDASAERLRTTEEDVRAARDAATAADARARGAEDRSRAAEERVRAADERADDLAPQLVEARRRVGELEAEQRRRDGDAARAESLERELDELRTELVVARGEVDGARDEVDKRTAELRKRVDELEAQNAKNEERVLKAYQKIKGDEKIREKARKAVAIALQLLDDGLPAESPEARGKVASLLGRE
jgi:DNA-binding response OmpR family regulator